MTKWILTVAVFVVLQPGLAQAQEDARQRLEKLIETFKEVKTPPENGRLGAPAREANQRTFARLDGYFAYDRLISDSLKDQLDKFTAAQKEEFFGKFRELIRWVAFPNAGTFFRDNEWKIARVEKAGGAQKTTLSVYVEEEGLDTEVTFVWETVGGALQVVDVEFDGDSLVTDYRNQFGRIIDKDGVAGLLSRVRDKHAEEKKRFEAQ